MPELDTLAAQVLDDGRRLDEAVHLVHVYTIEAHPALPEPTPYKGWTDSSLPNDPGGGVAYGDVGQPYTWEGRAALARRVLSTIDNRPIMLIDDLDRDGLVNPVWCTYGTAPNPAFVIAQDGTIALAELWFRTDALYQALLEQLGLAADAAGP